MIDRKNAPAPEKNISFKLPSIKQFALNNKLQVSFIRKENLPIVQIGFIISAGSKYDASGKKGLSNLTSMLIDEGAGEFSALELDNEFEMLGSILSVSTDHDSIFISLLTLKENLDRSLYLLSRIITSPQFNNEDFEREQKKAISKIIQYQDEPSYIASIAFDNLLCKNTPYAFPAFGYERTVSAITNNDIINFFAEYFTVDNSLVIAVGDIYEIEIKELLEKHFSGWNKYNSSTYGIFPPKNDSQKLYLINKEGAAQSEIRIGHTAKGRKSPDYFETLIMNSVLGGQFTSRINLNLREKKGFTYGASSSFNYNKEFGLFEVETAVHTQNTGESVAQILKELDNIRNGITYEEFEFAKSSLIKRYPLMFETNSQLAKNMALLYLFGLPDDYFDSYIPRIENSTLGQIIAAANENVHPDKATILIVGDKNSVLRQLKELSLPPAIETDIYGNVIQFLN